jgi:hypothetical protein
MQVMQINVSDSDISSGTMNLRSEQVSSSSSSVPRQEAKTKLFGK